MRTILFLIPFFAIISSAQQKAPPAVEVLINRMLGENVDVRATSDYMHFKGQSVVSARSYLYPNLSLTGSYSRGNPTSTSVPSSLSTIGDPSSLTASSGIQNMNEGWVGQLSTTYYLFTGHTVREGIIQAELGEKSAKIQYDQAKDQKKAELIRGLLEWQWLKELEKPLHQAELTLSSIQRHKKIAKNIFTAEDDSDFNEKESQFLYYKTKVSAGIGLVESAIENLIPEITTEELQLLPKIDVKFDIPDENAIENLYSKKSRSNNTNDLDLKIAESNYRVSQWRKPYIPTVMLSGGISRKGTPETTSNENEWNVSAIATFNLFDGFDTQARRKQAYLAVAMTQAKKISEGDKRILYLKHQRMTALVANAEYRHKNAIAKSKRIRLLDVERKKAKGIATDTEIALANLDYAKAQVEALEKLKEVRTASLDIAVELNEWDKVIIYEKK